MKEVKNYVKVIITLLDEEQFFERAGIFMDRDIIEQFLIETVTNNLEETGIPDLKPNQLEEVIDKTSKFIIEETFQDLLRDGKIVIAGMDEKGEFLYSSAEK
jgi:hypothetical protein